MDYKNIAERIKKHEGFSPRPYQCPTGHLTIGYGHNLDANGIDQETAELLLKKDIERAEKNVKNSFIWYLKLTEPRQYVLVDMCFNLGLIGLLKFKKFLAAAEAGNYQTAAKEMLDSKWAVQVGRRAVELAEIMETGEWK